jgi:hypothetical protein
MAEAVIGGEAIKVSLPNFVKLEAAWAYIEKVLGGADPMANVRALLGIVAVGSAPDDAEPDDLTVEKMAPRVAELAKALKSTEIPGLRGFVNPLLVEIGLAAPPGEPEPAEETETGSPSTAISEPSSARSSPASDQPTGTA